VPQTGSHTFSVQLLHRFTLLTLW